MDISPTLISILRRKAAKLQQESQKRLLMATCTGIGALGSVTVGVLLKQLLQQSDALSWGTVISSFVLIPASLLLGLYIWDSLRIKWSKSDELIYQLKFLEEEYLRNIQIIDMSGMSETASKMAKEKLYLRFTKAQSHITREYYLDAQMKDNLFPVLED